jgi:hypothetical protein
MGTEIWSGRVIGGTALLALLACWPSNGFGADYRVDEAAISDAGRARRETSASVSWPSEPYSSSEPTALSEAIRQNTPGNSEGQPLGLSWDKGFHIVTPKPPSGFSAVTGWGQIYQEAGAPVSPNAESHTVQIENFATYVHLVNGSWVRVQNQEQDRIGGAHYVADFSGGNIPWSAQSLPDGSVSADAPPAGYNDHFWPGVRGTYTPGAVDGVFVEADMKTDDPSANLVASIGADWWRDSAAQFVSGFANNPGVGQSNWVKLSTKWQTLYFSSLSPQQLAADPPVHLLSVPRRSR